MELNREEMEEVFQWFCDVVLDGYMACDPENNNCSDFGGGNLYRSGDVTCRLCERLREELGKDESHIDDSGALLGT